MKICIPVQENNGMESIVYGHFGSAPFFIMHDTGTGETKEITNKNQHHEHGACQPVATLGGEAVDAVIVGGIGAGAIMGLNANGIKVYKSIEGTIKNNITALEKGELSELMAHNACSHHGGCSH
ncbi:MAG: NifB/NifX family molybdenum-iron cluster-binding protein [Pseudomonadota bacterium]